MYLKRKFLLFLMVFSISVANSQSYNYDEFNEIKFVEEGYYLFAFKNGGSVLRQFVKKVNDHLIIVHENNVTTDIDLYEVKKIRVVDRRYIHQPNYWFPNLLSNRYITNPSAFTSGRWKGNIQNSYLVHNQATLGFSKYFDISTGYSIIESTGNIGARIGNIKLSENFHVGVMLSLIRTHLNRRGDLSILNRFGLVTYGNHNNNLTLGVGLRKSHKDNNASRSFQLNGMLRISEKTCLIAENLFNLSDELSMGHGLMFRFFNRNWSLDLGATRKLEILFNAFDQDDGIFAYFGFSYAFGKSDY